VSAQSESGEGAQQGRSAPPCAPSRAESRRGALDNVNREIRNRSLCDVDPDGALVFAHACKMGLEGIVSKRLGSRYRSGRSPDWLKFKNPEAPAVRRRHAGCLASRDVLEAENQVS
jgi:hypothetical protein